MEEARNRPVPTAQFSARVCIVTGALEVRKPAITSIDQRRFVTLAPCKTTRFKRHAPLLSPKSIIQDTEHVYQAGLRANNTTRERLALKLAGFHWHAPQLPSFTSFDLHHERHAASTRQPSHRTSGRPAARRYTRNARVAPPQKRPCAQSLAPHSSYSFTTTSSTTSTENPTTSTTRKRYNG